MFAALALLPLSVDAAKPNYCADAYRRCIVQCRDLPGVLSPACDAGCALAYLYCGS
jgi:hypothetical protein